MNILFWIILGAAAGWLASIIMGRNAKQGLLGDIVLGIVGAFVGGFVVSLFGGAGVTGFNIWSLLIAILGAITVIWLGRMLMGSRG